MLSSSVRTHDIYKLARQTSHSLSAAGAAAELFDFLLFFSGIFSNLVTPAACQKLMVLVHVKINADVHFTLIESRSAHSRSYTSVIIGSTISSVSLVVRASEATANRSCSNEKRAGSQLSWIS